MASSPDQNCSGLWHGRYAYRTDDVGVPFTARLVQDRAVLHGDIAEIATHGPSAGLTISASVAGRVSGARVTFLKTYDRPDEAYDSVAYEGALSADGHEIGGIWRLVGTRFAGTFLMIREMPAAVEDALAVEMRR